ncbi:MAG: oxygen-independent coproporphyrinogen III oxidase [Opitutales bacterium]|nr:oxygen-independent coproporphyrinogen III oxidase [Opitutales bacterium]
MAYSPLRDGPAGRNEKERLFHLFHHYNRPGPRYTSYPTALKFAPLAIEEQEKILADKKHAEANSPLSLYFHIPFCPSLCTFCGCHTIIDRKEESREEYLALLEKEMRRFQQKTAYPNRKVVQIHFGGGSPSYLTPRQIRHLGKRIREIFPIARNVEYSVEIDPRQVNRQSIEAFREIGVNRASIGVQDLDPDVQKAINRIQPREVSEQCLTWLREANIKAINCDLIYGLPKQTKENFERTLDQVLEWQPDRLTIFGYAHVPWVKPAQKVFEKKNILLPPEERMEILYQIHRRLPQEGYRHLGLDHFAAPHDPLAKAYDEGTMHRNFQGYSTLAGVEIAAFGISAISQGTNYYLQNVKELSSYRQILLNENFLPIERGYRLTTEDLMRREIIMEIMCGRTIDQKAKVKKWGEAFGRLEKEAEPQLQEMEADGLITMHSGKLAPTRIGRFFLRNIALVFDQHAKPAQEGQSPAFSKTI